MAVLSRKTCSVVIGLLESRLTRTDIERLFYDVEIPMHLLSGTNKAGLLLNVFRGLEQSQDYEHLLILVKAALKRLPLEDQVTLKASLMRDGFVGDDGDVVPDDNKAAEHKTALERLVERHSSKLSAAVLLHHLREAEALFRLEKWDASIGQSRNFVEQLLADLALHFANERGESPDLSRPVLVRNYLQNVDFFDEDERKKLVDGVYGFFSGQGSHPGIGEQSTARVCLSILWNFGFYVLEKFDVAT
jgi:hypothetical protein